MDPLVDNPFFVLELSPGASAMDIERQSRKLLAMLDLGLASALTHPSPLGPRPRTADDIRRATQTLQDPARRLAFELFAAGPGRAGTAIDDDAIDAAADGLDVGAALWWQP